ncbi:MAG: proprotein convertase P-domain-containing protein, partial [Pirellula sp.]
TDLIGGVSYDINTGTNNEYGYGRINAATLLSGIGNPEISVVDTTREFVSGSTLSMGSALAGQNVDVVLRIRNQGTKDLVLDSIDVPAPFSVVNFTASTIPLGGVKLIRVRFSPTTSGSFAGDLVINNNDSNESAYLIRLTATATAPRISGTAFEDFNGNGNFESFERGVSDLGFAYLDTNDNGNFDAGEQQSVFDANGYYSFPTLANGNYTVRTQLNGWTQTSANSFYSVTLNNASDFSLGNDFGYGKNNRYYSFFFEDLNADGIFNGTDLPLPNFVVSAGQSTTTYSSNVPVPINDVATSTSTISVPIPGASILDINALINLTHTWDSDLLISLIAPDNSRIILSDSNGGSGDNFTNTVFDDSAATSIIFGTAPFTGTFAPEEPLANFNGLQSGGTWTLEIVDQVGGDSGTLFNWSISILADLSAISDANGWAIMDVPAGPVTATLQLQPNWVYTLPSDGKHSFTATGSPIYGNTYGARIPPLPPTDLLLSNTSIQENEPVGTFVGTLSSIDPNRGDTFTYSLVIGAGDTDNGRFEIV